MARYQGTTTQRGLGSPHQKIRRAAVAALRDGDPCARCGGPMYRSQASMLDLDDFPGRVYGGPQVKRLSHRSCNRRAGQAITAAILRARGGLTPRQQAAIRIKQAAASTKTASRGIARQSVKATTSSARAQLRTSRQW